MSTTSARTGLIALGLAAAVALPAAASAQSWSNGQSWRNDQSWGNGQSWRGDYGRRGGYDYNSSSFKGYPEFRDVREHLKEIIQQGEAEGSLTRADAQEFVNQYKDIEAQELRDYRRYGSNLPWGERQNIRQQLSQLDGEVDQARRED